jgi:serine/threonine protein phosphatase PrpC
VADGMGGHEAGEVASGMCVRALAQLPQLATGERTATASQVQHYLDVADESIRAATGSRAGTTLAGVVVVEQMGIPYWLVLNIGDSRTYRLNQGRLTQVSVDHSEVQELVDTGEITAEQATVHPRRHVVTRALGAGDETEADYWLLPVEEGDRMMVCSDGLNGEISDEQMFDILSTVADPQEAVDQLIQAALRSGGRDNITVIVVDARNVVNGDVLSTTAQKTVAAAEDEDTLPRPVVIPEAAAQEAASGGAPAGEGAAGQGGGDTAGKDFAAGTRPSGSGDAAHGLG